MYCRVCLSFDNLKECGNCHNVYYCSKKCQAEDWLEHQRNCFKKILYLGMADDIWAVLNLDDSFDTIYVIDDFDDAYGGTIENQREIIKRIITDGNNSVYDTGNVLTLRHKGIILKESLKDNVWKLKFTYGKRVLKLIVYYQDFMEEWPKEIKNISHVLIIGSALYEELNKEMIMKRTENPFRVTALEFLHEDFPFKFQIPDRFYPEYDEDEYEKLASIIIFKK
jgi:hypothetical protein